MKRLRFFAILAIPLMILIAIYLVMGMSGMLPRHMGKVESLKAPVSLAGWTDAGLQTADSHILPVPGIQHLPPNSPALAEATKRGAEVTPDGHLICLVRVFRWCGNDPITADILRIDLSDMLTYLQVGEPSMPVPNPDLLTHEVGGNFQSDSGWNISDYIEFQMWQSEKMSHP